MFQNIVRQCPKYILDFIFWSKNQCFPSKNGIPHLNTIELFKFFYII